MTGVEQIAHAFADTGKRAALMPYLMGGFPTLEESVRIGQACVQAGADLLELGVPYSDPLADGPVIHEAGTRALAAGATLAGVLEVARALSPSVPVVFMCYSNMVLAPGVDAFVDRLAQTGASGLIVPDLPFEEAPEVLAACDAHGVALGAACRSHYAVRAPGGDRGAGAWLPLHGVGRRHHRRARRALRPVRRGRGPREGMHRQCQWRSASGSQHPHRPSRPPKRAPTA